MNKPQKFRKKPVVIEAMQFDGHNSYEICSWVRENGGVIADFSNAKIPFLNIMTLEGVMRVDFNDIVIKGIQEEFYPCKPDIFGDSYEKV